MNYSYATIIVVKLIEGGVRMAQPQYRVIGGGYFKGRDRKRRYIVRRLIALTILLLLGYGFYLGGRWLMAKVSPPPRSEAPALVPSSPSPPKSALTFLPEQRIAVPALLADGKPLQLAIGPAEGGRKQVALLTGSTADEQMLGQPLSLPHEDQIALRDLRLAKNLLIAEGRQSPEGTPKTVQVAGAPALEAVGGEPTMQAWRIDPVKGFIAADYYALAAPVGPRNGALLIVDTWLNHLWYYEDGRVVLHAPVGTGRHIAGPEPTWANQESNYRTPLGRFSIANKYPGLVYMKERIPAGDPRNPLGTRWMGFQALDGDRGLLWAIHGTNEPTKVGLWASDGSVLMAKPALEALYERVAVGTQMHIYSSKPQQ
jgi:lipoprotein-anchoring transpeptidase ErfK/SrfK